MSNLIIVFGLLGLISACVGQGVSQIGPCENIDAVPAFDLNAYQGIWYDIESLPSNFQGGTCNTATYTLNADQSAVNVLNTQVNNGILGYATGTAVPQATAAGSGKFDVLIGISTTPVPYWVLDTDYETFALVYSCSHNAATNTRTINSWKLGRNKGPLPVEATTRINAIINAVPALSAAAGSFITRDHSEEACSYSVEFDGACPTTVTGVPDFNVERFLGTWYEFARHPQPTQTGQCNRAVYGPAAISTGVYPVENSQVTNEARSTITGQLQATAQSGVLAVTLNVGTEQRLQNLHVLATDYEHYALLYSCTTIGNRRRIGSWQLRKTLEPLSQEVTNAMNTAFNAVFSNNADLHVAYYQPTSQTAASCFYYPDFPENPPEIVLPGPCDASITGVPNFDAEKYQGIWYDIESLPSNFQGGTCNTATYTLNADQSAVNVLNTQVNNGILGYATGTAVPQATAAGSGKFDVLIGTSTTPVPYWVLDTDYETFALVYSCSHNAATNTRTINSWKLGRNKGPLPVEATTRINAIINAVPALSAAAASNSFITRDHSEEACSYSVEFDGACPTTVTGVPDFNLARFLGTWYEFARHPQPTQTGQCNRAVYGPAAISTGVYPVENSQVTNEARSTITGQLQATAQSGVLAVTLNVGTEQRLQNLHVLATDYEHYALLYSCTTIGNRRRIGSWQLRKTLEPLSQEVTNAMNTAFNAVFSNNADLHVAYYQPTSQTAASCFYYPDFPENPPEIVLPGPCDASITGVPNFDAEKFLGVWLEDARYPQPTQTGQCNRAVYGPEATTPGVYPVENSQVINEARFTISGEVTTTPQSGVLAVTLLVGGERRTSNLHVLATDYDTFALVYTCTTNLAENTRRVGSWKLKRSSDPLSASALNDINDAISKTQGLREDLYRPTSQTAASCFYYPDFPANQPEIVLPGLCDTSITGVPDFDAARFLGRWLEVARYPQPTQTGQCNRALYGPEATTPGVYPVENSQVINEARFTISGEVTTTDQSGVLAVTLIVGGERRTSNLHVLATDYETFALLYSCTDDTEENQRRVGSWKLSRSSDPFSPEAINAINDAISNTQGLREDLYRPTSQTAASCFYYPDFPTDPEFIELPGLCDTSITGVANFDVNSFVGTWYEIARYPQPTQTGQCNRAEYGTGATTGIYTVKNSQVINEAQFTILGEARSTGQPGVLEVTFTINDDPRSQQLYVLATDHTSYALLYSCTNNLAENTRRVGSWKMSKSLDALSDAALNAINAAVSNTQGLREDLYRPTSQTAASCFYYPDFPANPPEIVLPGPCDASIAGVPNFDAERYLGQWYEVARYPQPTQTGQCNRAVYGPGTTTGVYTVENSQVVNEALSTISGEARPTTQSGVLEVTFTVNGEERIQNLHVLATDYDNYALVYSCTNLPDNSRRVGSWKLSRNLASLSEDSNNAIDAVVSNTQGLRADLYQETLQTEDACWYYPAQTADNVVIPGLCDTAIVGVPNINVTRFANGSVWYHIRRYDAVGERSCIGTRLTLDGDYIDVHSIEVIGEEADRSEGIARLNAAATGKFDLEMTDSDKVEIYVLATDYDNYAIAYTCENVGTTHRQIGAWLLSRTRTWPNAGNAALNSLIDARREIHGAYFKDIPHILGDGDCPEPSSAFLFRSSIIVIFVCTVLQLVW